MCVNSQNIRWFKIKGEDEEDITELEILKNINNLKNSKSPGKMVYFLNFTYYNLNIE